MLFQKKKSQHGVFRKRRTDGGRFVDLREKRQRRELKGGVSTRRGIKLFIHSPNMYLISKVLKFLLIHSCTAEPHVIQIPSNRGAREEGEGEPRQEVSPRMHDRAFSTPSISTRTRGDYGGWREPERVAPRLPAAAIRELEPSGKFFHRQLSHLIKTTGH